MNGVKSKHSSSVTDKVLIIGTSYYISVLDNVLISKLTFWQEIIGILTFIIRGAGGAICFYWGMAPNLSMKLSICIAHYVYAIVI